MEFSDSQTRLQYGGGEGGCYYFTNTFQPLGASVHFTYLIRIIIKENVKCKCKILAITVFQNAYMLLTRENPWARERTLVV